VNIRRGVLWDSSAILALLDADEAVLLRSIAILFSTAGLRSSVYRVDFAAAVITCGEEFDFVRSRTSLCRLRAPGP